MWELLTALIEGRVGRAFPLDVSRIFSSRVFLFSNVEKHFRLLEYPVVGVLFRETFY